MNRALALLLTLLLCSCGADHRARKLLDEYAAAAEQHDIPAMVRLGDPNMRALIERTDEKPDYPARAIREILPHPLRVIHHDRGIAYIGWVGTDLLPIVVGEGRTISKYSSLRETAGTNDTTDWQVSIMSNEWAFASYGSVLHPDPKPLEAAFMSIDDGLLRAWLFDGSIAARHEIHRRLDG